MPGVNTNPKNTLKEATKWLLRQTLYRQEVYHPSVEDKPYLVRLDINDTCNLACKMCFYPEFAAQFKPNNYMALDDFKKIAREIFPYTYYLQLACSFEPLLHPQFVEIVEEIDKYNVLSCGLVTNGTLLRGKRALAILDSKSIDTISVSIDGITPETFEAIRGRPMLEKVLDNLADFQQMKRDRGTKNPQVKMNTVVMRSNLHELKDLMLWCVEHEIDQFQCSHVEPFGQNNDESVFHCPTEYAQVRDELLALSRKTGLSLFFPPPMEPEFYDEKLAKYVWKHCENELVDLKKKQSENRDGYASEISRETAIMLTHPYPENVPCITPWMTLVINVHGDISPCGYRLGMPTGNILRDSHQVAVNSIKILKLRKALLNGRKDESCPMCSSCHPNLEPMTQRQSAMVFSETETG